MNQPQAEKLIRDFAEPDSCNIEGVASWTIRLQDDKGHRIGLRVLEENVQASGRAHCDNCRVAGWSHHPVSVHRYHFIIPLVADVDENNSQGIGKGRKLCPNCSAVIASNAKRCTACGHDAVRGTLLESQTHLLHGVIHTNGFGHLLRINGRERGSRLVTGRQLMGLWDRICTMLNAREVTCMDMSKKLGLDLRLLHGLAYGHSWYGRWGYRFGKGCYGVTEDVYKHALAAAATTPLAAIEEHYRGLDPVRLGCHHRALPVVGQREHLLAPRSSIADARHTAGNMCRSTNACSITAC
ncbi:unnamed protein product [Closterium sp. NIES-65]|nr:unnamed protein product [Closterium sp. NIES-65]CAI6005007.1 unnamed protein product [Closterium sp. NIES-65]